MATPASTSFFVTSILGFLITAVYTYSGKLDISWGIAFMLVFIIMFIASVVVITPSAKELK